MSEKRRVIGAAGGALGLGGFAAALGLCCSLPWAVALLGVGGAVAFARLAFLMPYALIASVALLAVGFWWAYRPLRHCADGRCAPESRRSSRLVVWIAAIIVGAFASVALTTTATAEPNPAPAYVALDDSATALRDDFNRASGSVRLLFVVDPICPGCLRGLDDVNRSLLAKVDDARLQTFVVHVPVIGAKAKDVAPATELIESGHIRHYWNESGTFGWLVTDAAGLQHDGERVYAWDVWLIYGPEAVWDGRLPPRPRRLMHQLRALQGSAEFPRLDSEAYAREVRQLLAGLSDPTVKP
jgi:hypothetical protein